MNVDRVLTLGISADEMPIEALRRLRLIVLATIILVVMGGPAACHYGLGGQPRVAAALAGMLLGMLTNLALLRMTRRPDLCAHVIVGLLFALVLTANLSSKGSGSSALIWISVLPLGAFLLCGIARGWLWTIVAGALTSLLWGLLQGDGGGAVGHTAMGGLADLESRLALLLSIAGFASAFVGTQRKAERDFMAAAAALRSEVRERRDAERRARDATRAKSEFLASMSHEIRTPMVGITGMTDLLLADALTRNQRDWATIVRRSADTLLGLINDILDFSRIEARQFSLESIPFDIQTTAEDVVELLSPIARQRGLDIALSCRNVPPALLGDPQRVRQLLMNLVGNALKFTNTGHVFVKIAVDPGDADRLRIEVQDTGIGIAADGRERLFEPFTQADTTTARRFGGSGLGLAISKKLVGLMGGEIGLSSVPGQGSTFWFTLPTVVPDTPPLPAMARVSGIRAAAVSDRPTTLRAVTEVLEQIGADVLLATAEPGDLQSIDTTDGPLDLVVLDGRTTDPTLLAADLSSRLLVFEPPSASGRARRSDENFELVTWPVRATTLAEAVTGVRTIEFPVEDFSDVGAGRRVLLVEDNEVNQVVLSTMLEQCGCSVEVAGGGREAIGLIETTRYDLVLLDCHMPDLDGYATIGAIRRLGLDATTLPVIALTASVLPEEPERCRAAGMNDYLSKPVGHADLADMLQRWLSPPSSAAAKPVDASPTAQPLSSSDDTPLVFDRTGTLARLGGRDEILLRVIRLYQRDASDILQRLRSGVRDGDLPSVREVAHRLKGSLGSLGGLAAKSSVERLESRAKAGDASTLKDDLASVEAELARLDDALRATVDTLG